MSAFDPKRTIDHTNKFRIKSVCRRQLCQRRCLFSTRQRCNGLSLVSLGFSLPIWAAFALFLNGDRSMSSRFTETLSLIQPWQPRGCFRKKDMMQGTRSIIPAWLFSVAILISGAHYNVAQAQDNPKKHRTAVALACGKEIKKQCSGSRVDVGLIGAERTAVPMGANSVLECFQKSQEKLSARCAALANNVVRSCDRDAAHLCQGVVAGPQGNIVGCLTTAKRMVSSQCNAALDAAFLR
jgi:hypothetical protein